MLVAIENDSTLRHKSIRGTIECNNELLINLSKSTFHVCTTRQLEVLSIVWCQGTTLPDCWYAA
jgi:hypothetical protein